MSFFGNEDSFGELLHFYHEAFKDTVRHYYKIKKINRRALEASELWAHVYLEEPAAAKEMPAVDDEMAYVLEYEDYICNYIMEDLDEDAWHRAVQEANLIMHRSNLCARHMK